jgi:HSP20 family molecular chaperone IbpA
MKFPTTIACLALLPRKSKAWSSLSRPGLIRPLVVYSPWSMFQKVDKELQKFDPNFTHISPRYRITDNSELFQIVVDVPGLKPEDIDVSVQDKILSITGRTEKSENKFKVSSKFSQSFSLDPAIQLDKLEAILRDGFLMVKAPKDPKYLEEYVRKIPITYDKKDSSTVDTKKSDDQAKASEQAKVNEQTKQEDLVSEIYDKNAA